MLLLVQQSKFGSSEEPSSVSVLSVLNWGKVLQEGHEHLLKLRKGDVVRVVWGPSCRSDVVRSPSSTMGFECRCEATARRKIMKYLWSLWKPPSPSNRLQSNLNIYCQESMSTYSWEMLGICYTIIIIVLGIWHYLTGNLCHRSQVSRIEPQQSLGLALEVGDLLRGCWGTP